MFYPEFELKVRSGEIMVGDLMWVTGYYHNDALLKPTRHVPPTLVQVMANDELAQSRNVLLSGYHFRPCGKSGKLLGRALYSYESSANRYNRGDGGSLHIFFTEDEAKVAYVAAALVVKSQLAEAERLAIDNFARLNAEVDKRIAKNK